MIDIRDLRHSFGAVQALGGVSFHVAGGDIVGFVGRNGAGKTTTLRAVATLLRPDAGTVLVDGQDVRTRAHEVRQRVGIFTGSMRLPERLTAREALDYQALLHGMSKKERSAAITDLAGRFSLDFLDKRCEDLSTGMAQRVMIARALVHQPRALLLDEASSGLDVVARRELQDMVRAVAREGCAVVFSTHVLGELADFASRTVVVERGRIVDEHEGFDQERTLAHLEGRERGRTDRPETSWTQVTA